MCWKDDYLTLKDLEKRGKRLETLELVEALRSFFREEVEPRLETARTALTRAGFHAEIRSTVPMENLGSGDSVLLEVRGDRRSLLSPSLWFRVMPRVGHNGDRAAIGVLYSQPFGGEWEEGFPLGFTAPERLQTQLDRFLVHRELNGH
jgi:hypothetical protein